MADLAGAGLAGVEVDHPDHAPEDRELSLRGSPPTSALSAPGRATTTAPTSRPVAAETTAPEAFDDLVYRAAGAEVLG